MKTFKDLKEEVERINNIDKEGFDNNWVLLNFAREQALINLHLIKPHTDHYNIIVMYLVTGKNVDAVFEDCVGAAMESAHHADDNVAYEIADTAYASAFYAGNNEDIVNTAVSAAVSAVSAIAANAAYWAAANAAGGDDAAGGADADAASDAAIADADYTKSIESLNTLASEYLALLPKEGEL